MTQAEMQFHQMMNALAKLSRFDLDEDVIAVYDQVLSPDGYEKVNVALRELLIERDGRDPFPSVAEIRRKMGKAISDETVAEDAANRILAAVRRRGHTWPDLEKLNWPRAAIAELGECAWETVKKLGGWMAVCEQDESETTLRAQYKRLALAVLEQARAGVLRGPALALPGAPGTGPGAKQLAGPTGHHGPPGGAPGLAPGVLAAGATKPMPK